MGDPENWTTFESAPSNVPIWCVYGDDNWLKFGVFRKRDYPGRNSALWGYSVYRRQPGFRTLGVGPDWCIENKCRFFANQDDGLAYLRQATEPALSAL